MHISKPPNKLLGQNFLTCKWVLSDLAKAAELTDRDTVLEIGPGTGVLTRFLAARVKKVVTVEKDAALAERLAKTQTNTDDYQQISDDRRSLINNVEIITGDILRFNFSVLPNTYKVVANIPYYLTSRLIRVLLEQEKKPRIIVLMIQKEVAKRIVVQPPDMNILALSVQAYGTPEIIAEVSASCFNPPPKVDSAILKISSISEDFFTNHAIKPKDFFVVLKAGFSSRRKLLTNNLQSFASKKDLEKALSAIGHPTSARAQELSCEEWAELTHILA